MQQSTTPRWASWCTSLGYIVLTCCASGPLVLFGAGAGEAATVGVLTGAAVLAGQAGARWKHVTSSTPMAQRRNVATRKKLHGREHAKRLPANDVIDASKVWLMVAIASVLILNNENVHKTLCILSFIAHGWLQCIARARYLISRWIDVRHWHRHYAKLKMDDDAPWTENKIRRSKLTVKLTCAT